MGCLKSTFLSIVYALKRIRRNRNAVDICSVYLEPGCYKNTLSGDVVFKSNNQRRLTIDTYSSYKKNTKLAYFLIRIINRLTLYKVADLSQQYHGTELLVSSSEKEYKVFDYEAQILLTKYLDITKAKLIKNNKQLFSNYFNIPDVVGFIENDSVLIEKLVKRIKFSSQDAFENLGYSYIQFIKGQAPFISIKYSEYKEECDYFASRFGKSALLDYLEAGIVRLMTHGDLWSSNVMFDGDIYYVTDFEHAGERYFLFDFFCFIFSEWHFKGNPDLLILYFSGSYDQLLDNIFKALSIFYEKDRKQEYILTFLVSMTFERWKEDMSMDKKINAFINEYLPAYYA